MPALNLPAFRAGTRTSPIDRGNLNRSFPGEPDGTVTQKIADYVRASSCPAPTSSSTSTPAAGPSTSCPSPPPTSSPTRRRRPAPRPPSPPSPPPSRCRCSRSTPSACSTPPPRTLGKTFVTTELGGGGTARAETAAHRQARRRATSCATPASSRRARAGADPLARHAVRRLLHLRRGRRPHRAARRPRRRGRRRRPRRPHPPGDPHRPRSRSSSAPASTASSPPATSPASSSPATAPPSSPSRYDRRPTRMTLPLALADILAARRTIAGGAVRTPLVPSAAHPDLLLKLELAQPIGAFKLRGALNAVAAPPARRPRRHLLLDRQPRPRRRLRRPGPRRCAPSSACRPSSPRRSSPASAPSAPRSASSAARRTRPASPPAASPPTRASPRSRPSTTAT